VGAIHLNSTYEHFYELLLELHGLLGEMEKAKEVESKLKALKESKL